MFRWSDVASRTSQIYEGLANRARPSPLRRIAKLVWLDPLTGFVALAVALIQNACLAALSFYVCVVAYCTPGSDVTHRPEETRETRSAEMDE